MKKLFIILAIILAVVGFWKVNKYLSDKLYEECMASKMHSQETCEYNAYYK